MPRPDKTAVSTLIDVSKTAVLRVPSDSDALSKRSIDCEFHGMENKRLCLRTAERVAVLTPVTLEYNDALFLGDVVACGALASGVFDLQVKVEQVLTGLERLMTLRARLLGEGFAHTSAETGAAVRVARRM